MAARTALIVDDSAQVRALLSLLLRKRWAYVVAEAASAEEALTVYTRSPYSFDIVIIDFQLGKVSGVQLLQELRAIRQDCCAIMITGSTYLAAPALEKASIKVPILDKPFHLDTLEKVLEDTETIL